MKLGQLGQPATEAQVTKLGFAEKKPQVKSSFSKKAFGLVRQNINKEVPGSKSSWSGGPPISPAKWRDLQGGQPGGHIHEMAELWEMVWVKG